MEHPTVQLRNFCDADIYPLGVEDVEAIVCVLRRAKGACPKAASEINNLDDAGSLLGHTDKGITKRVYRRAGELVKPTKWPKLRKRFPQLPIFCSEIRIREAVDAKDRETKRP